MANNDGTFPGIIRWPCDTLSYRKTVRGRYYRYWLLREWFKAFLACMTLGGPLAIWLLATWLQATRGALRWYGDKPERLFLVPMVLVATMIVATAIAWFLNRRVLFGMQLSDSDPNTFVPGLRDTKRLHSDWREEWLAFEKQSTSHIALLRQPSTGSFSPADVVNAGPRFPAFFYRLSEYQDNTVAKVTIARDPNSPSEIALTSSEVLAQVRGRLFFEVSRSLAHVHPDSVIGYSVIGNAWTLVSISMLHGNVQIWTLFQVQQAGMSLSCRLQSGYHWWINEGYSGDGLYYEGDVRAFHQSVWHDGLKITAKHVAGVLVPFVGWGIMALGGFFTTLALARRTWRDLRYREFSRQTLTQIGPRAGDCVDLDLLGYNRQSVTKSYYKLVLSDDAKSQVQGFRQTIANVVQEAVTLCVRSPRDGVAINWAAPELEGVVR